MLDDNDVFVVLKIEPKASNILGKCPIAELHVHVLSRFFCLFEFFVLRQSIVLAQAGLQPLILLPPLPRCRDNWRVPPQPQKLKITLRLNVC